MFIANISLNYGTADVLLMRFIKFTCEKVKWTVPQNGQSHKMDSAIKWTVA